MFYHLFKTTCKVDESAFFGIHGNNDPMWDEHINYIGSGRKLVAKIKQYGRSNEEYARNFTTEVMMTSSVLEDVEKYIKGILTPATYSDPRCLNVSPAEMAADISAAKLGVPNTEDHNTAISLGMEGNQNALGHVVSDDAKNQIAETRSNAKLKWIHNPVTKQEKQVSLDQILQEGVMPGFKVGRLPKSK